MSKREYYNAIKAKPRFDVLHLHLKCIILAPWQVNPLTQVITMEAEARMPPLCPSCAPEVFGNSETRGRFFCREPAKLRSRQG